MIKYVRKVRYEIVRLLGFNPDDYFGPPGFLLYNEELIDQLLNYLYAIGYEQGYRRGRAEASGKVPVHRYSEEGELIRTYDSIRDAARLLDTSRIDLYKAIKRGWRHLGSYWLRDGQDFDTLMEEKEKRKLLGYDDRRIPVEKVDINGNVVREYRSKNEAVEGERMSDKTLNKLLNGGRVYKGHYWRKKC